MSVDPPLSQGDIETLKNVYRYTPNVSILLTKVDLLSPQDRGEVLDFVRTQLENTFGQSPEILPYSVQPGFERLREQLEKRLIQRTLGEFDSTRRAIVARKVDTLLMECSDFLTLNLKSAELLDFERENLKLKIIREKEAMVDAKSGLRLVVRNAIGGTRDVVAARLEPHQREIENRLLAGLAAEFPSWKQSLVFLLKSFERWLGQSLSGELSQISLSERPQLVAGPLHGTRRQVFRYLRRVSRPAFR